MDPVIPPCSTGYTVASRFSDVDDRCAGLTESRRRCAMYDPPARIHVRPTSSDTVIAVTQRCSRGEFLRPEKCVRCFAQSQWKKAGPTIQEHVHFRECTEGKGCRPKDSINKEGFIVIVTSYKPSHIQVIDAKSRPYSSFRLS